MSTILLDGKKLSQSLEQSLSERVQLVKQKMAGETPILATILVGADPSSATYVKMKGNACKREGIIVVNYQGTVNLAERMAAVEDACVQIDDVKKAILLIDVRGIKVDMTIEEQKKFGQYLPSRAELKHAKVAVLHQDSHNPNDVINGYAYLDGYHLVAFENINDARLWLLGAIK